MKSFYKREIRKLEKLIDNFNEKLLRLKHEQINSCKHVYKEQLIEWGDYDRTTQTIHICSKCGHEISSKEYKESDFFKKDVEKQYKKEQLNEFLKLKTIFSRQLQKEYSKKYSRKAIKKLRK